MAIASNWNICILLVHLVLISGQKRDGLCLKINTILCVNDVLLKITSSTGEINTIGQQIEQSIYKSGFPRRTLDSFVHKKLESIRLNLSSKYHQWINGNNINQTGLINIIQEENYAFSYLYKSINRISELENLPKSHRNSLKKIEQILGKDILCNYRSILYVYSANWLSIDDIHGIQILQTRKRTTSSLISHGHAIILMKLLQEWMKNVNEFVSYIERKPDRFDCC